MGSSLFKKPIDKGGNQAGFKISGNDAKSTPPDSLINCVLNLKNIILNSSFGVKENYLRDLSADGSSNIITSFLNPKNNIGLDTKKIIDRFGQRYSIAVDDENNPNVLCATIHTKQEFFVTWGWMEDNIINRYVSFEAGDDRLPKLTMRSIDTILDKKGLPISTEKFLDKLPSAEENQLDGEISEIQSEYDIDLSDLNELNDFLKSETLIRNPPGLFPVNPFLSFIPETNYPGEVKIDGVTIGFGKFGAIQLKGNSNEANFYNSFLKLTKIQDFKIKKFSS